MQAYLPSVRSSNVFRAAHTGDGMLVHLKGGYYFYSGVPYELMLQMVSAESAGKFFNEHIKSTYAYRPATTEESLMIDQAEPVEHARPNGEENVKDSANAEHLERSLKQARAGCTGTPAEHAQRTGMTVDDFLSTGLGGDPNTVKALGAHLQDSMRNMILPHRNNWDTAVDLKFLDPNVKVKYAKEGDAAFDLMAVTIRDPQDNDVEPAWPQMTFWLQPGQHVLIGTGIAMKLPIGLAGLVTPRSGLAKKLRVSVVNTPGLIDSGYTGEIGVLLENRGNEPFEIKQYDRIAQYLIVPAITPVFRVVDDLEHTERGASGFGSTGKEKVVL